MNEENSLVTVALAIHKNIVDHFHAQPLSDKQVISDSIRPEYDIMTLETADYTSIVPIIQQFMPFIKVLMPVELDLQIRERMEAYDLQDLTKFIKAS